MIKMTIIQSGRWCPYCKREDGGIANFYRMKDYDFSDIYYCEECGQYFCREHGYTCINCGDLVCPECGPFCEECGEPICENCIQWINDFPYCPECAEKLNLKKIDQNN
ncbi:MAG: hypothetical protein ACTSU2_02550 [Promethearchaeota archaeon]